ncbi:MAG: hypothetical protein GY775_12705 [Candidatus Scalindua sp.]|nr:hypothetical protein [Candidatus Scalindua sp.]
MDYHLEVVIEGLKSICATQEVRLKMFSSSESVVDDNFDFIALDSLDYLIENGLITTEIGEDINNLYKEADQSIKDLDWKQEDKLVESNSSLVKQWQDRANSILCAINAHNKSSKKDAQKARASS